MIAGLCAQSTAGCRQRGGDRGDEGGEQSQQTYQQMGGKMFARALSMPTRPLIPLSQSLLLFLRLSAVQTRIKQAAILFANLFHTLVLLQDHCYN